MKKVYRDGRQAGAQKGRQVSRCAGTQVRRPAGVHGSRCKARQAGKGAEAGMHARTQLTAMT